MPINPDLLIAAPMLQDAIIDKTTGLPLYNGKIVLWQDNARTILKNWYYQTGSPGSYTYLPLPNPLTLSSAGSIVDINGVDTIPFYYPYSEVDNVTPQPYYIKVFDQFGQLQFDRQNFPFNPESTPEGLTVATNKNLICNSGFWRNAESINATTITINPNYGLFGMVVAPSQHDNFAMPDMQFIKNANGAVDTITFYNFVNDENSTSGTTFPDQIISNQITPQFYMNLNCTSAGGESSKYLQIPIQSQVTALSGVENCTFTIAAMTAGGNTNNQLQIAIYQYLGTGASSPAPIILKTLNLTDSFVKYNITFTMPSAQGVTLGAGGDDGLYIQIRYPAGVTTNINITYPAFYLSAEVPTNDWQTYDEVNAIIASPRTGDKMSTLNGIYSTSSFGWVPANDGTIGNPSSGATTRASVDTFPLFNLLWYVGSQITQSLVPMYTSTGTPVAYGSSAIADFTANNRLSLTKTLARVDLGGIPNHVFSTVTAVSGTTLTLNTSGYVFFNNYVPVTINSTGTVPSPLNVNTIYYLILQGGNNVGLTTAPFGSAITFTSAGTGTITLTLYGGADTGVYLGENTHTQTIAEMPAHNHPGSVMPFQAVGAAGGSTQVVETPGGVSGNYPVTVASQGGGNAFNVMQPGTFYNVYFKL